jgi:hypothetical protein
MTKNTGHTQILTTAKYAACPVDSTLYISNSPVNSLGWWWWRSASTVGSGA